MSKRLLVTFALSKLTREFQTTGLLHGSGPAHSLSSSPLAAPWQLSRWAHAQTDPAMNTAVTLADNDPCAAAPGPTSLADAAKASQVPGAPAVPEAGLPCFKKTFYKRNLPSPPATAFSSPEGRVLFQEALAQGTMTGFFKLIEQYSTQDEPAFCGLSSLAMVLNALSIDPRRPWKGAWRWFHEKLLDCCLPLDYVQREGIVLSQAACLARCNGAQVDLKQFGQFNLDQFREEVRQVCTSGEEHIVVSYSRRIFLQTGDGHYSPIGGYHADRDLVLILDVARFKYPPHWVPLPMLYEAMAARDPVTGQPRGYMRMSTHSVLDSLLFTLDIKTGGWHEMEHFIRHQALGLVQGLAASEQLGPDDVIRQLVASVPLQGLHSFIVVRDGSAGCARDRCVPHAARSQLLSELRNTPLYQLVVQCLQEAGVERGDEAVAAAPHAAAGSAAAGSSSLKHGCAHCLGKHTAEHAAAPAGGQHHQPAAPAPAPEAAPEAAAPEAALAAGSSGVQLGPSAGLPHSPLALASAAAQAAAQAGAQALQHGSVSSFLPEKLCLLLLLRKPAEWQLVWGIPEQQQRWSQLIDVSGVSIVETEATYLQEQFAHIDAVVTSGNFDLTCGTYDFKLDCTVHGHCR